MMAARFGYVRIAAMLCKVGEGRVSGPLSAWVVRVETLYQSHSSPQPSSLEMRDFRGQTALFHAVRGGSEELIRLLMVQGADVNAW